LHNSQNIIIFAVSIKIYKSNIKNQKRMATIEEWWEYYKELQEKLEEIQKSDLPEEIKQELTDIYLDKMNIVKKYFLE